MRITYFSTIFHYTFQSTYISNANFFNIRWYYRRRVQFCNISAQFFRCLKPWTMFLSYSIPFIHGVKSIALWENMVDSKAVIRLQDRVDYSGFPYLDTRTRRRMYRRESCSKDCLRPWDWINPYPEEGYDLLVIHMRLTGTLIHFDGRTCIFARLIRSSLSANIEKLCTIDSICRLLG